MDTKIKQEIIQQGYGQMVTSKLRQRWEGYLLTFMFNQLRGSRRSVFRQMEREIERVYATVLTRIVRKPHSETYKNHLPIWIGCPDFPVPKHVKMELRDVVVNDGLHIHAIALIPPTSRLPTSLDQHFQDYQDRYVRSGYPLQRVHATEITSNPSYVVGYGFKSVKRGRVDLEEVIILPRSRSELDRDR